MIFQGLEQQLNTALISQVLPRIRNGKLKLAIDLNLIPYYGQPSEFAFHNAIKLLKKLWPNFIARIAIYYNLFRTAIDKSRINNS